MAKQDRVPPAAWPALMSDVNAARYLDLADSTFHALIKAGRLPAGTKVWGTELVRWRREALDAAIALEFGLPTENGVAPLAAGDDWMEAIRAN
jgi:excisionase family DNA binding protein